ncbi:P cell-type agglutination protein map4-like [Chrysoperla carnea]|uniref:P cell-type agglutination protein map4-like n=1 Tax=Chrysoperla carnea TaxID=189513 RepID=UPI001D092A8B|nr:P cell-type agglutination protein map4-like [Chrysoperla carnea]
MTSIPQQGQPQQLGQLQRPSTTTKISQAITNTMNSIITSTVQPYPNQIPRPPIIRTSITNTPNTVTIPTITTTTTNTTLIRTSTNTTRIIVTNTITTPVSQPSQPLPLQEPTITSTNPATTFTTINTNATTSIITTVSTIIITTITESNIITATPLAFSIDVRQSATSLKTTTVISDLSSIIDTTTKTTVLTETVAAAFFTVNINPAVSQIIISASITTRNNGIKSWSTHIDNPLNTTRKTSQQNRSHDSVSPSLVTSKLQKNLKYKGTVKISQSQVSPQHQESMLRPTIWSMKSDITAQSSLPPIGWGPGKIPPIPAIPYVPKGFGGGLIPPIPQPPLPPQLAQAKLLSRQSPAANPVQLPQIPQISQIPLGLGVGIDEFIPIPQPPLPQALMGGSNSLQKQSPGGEGPYQISQIPQVPIGLGFGMDGLIPPIPQPPIPPAIIRSNKSST